MNQLQNDVDRASADVEGAGHVPARTAAVSDWHGPYSGCHQHSFTTDPFFSYPTQILVEPSKVPLLPRQSSTFALQK